MRTLWTVSLWRIDMFKNVITFIFTLLIGGSLFAQDFQKYDISATKIEKKAYEKYIGKSDKTDYRYEKDTIIDVDEKIDGNIIVIEGDLTVKGQVDGDILVILGKVKIENSAVINGNVTSVDGRIYQEEKSLINGNQIETKIKNLFPREEWDDDFEEDFERSRFGRNLDRYEDNYSTLPLGKQDNSILVRYNRVQGLFLGVAAPKSISGKYNKFTIHGFLGYGFQEKRWNYEVGLDRWFFDQRDYRFELGASAYDFTDTRDNWMITPTENSLAAFFLHKDFQDFYRRYGYEFHACQNLSIFLQGKIGYRNDSYEILNKNTNWSLFRGGRNFNENPIIEEGNMRSIYGEIYYDTRNNKKNPSRGWYAKLSGETSNAGLNSDFSFNQYILELRTYQKTGRYERIDTRLKIGTGEGDLPVQKGFELGGISTLRGFGFKQFRSDIDTLAIFHSGYDRMLLGNIEYNIDPKIFSTGIPLIDEIQYIFFFDFGNVWNSFDVTNKNEFYNGFSHLKWNDIKSDFGIAFSSRDGNVRINIAKRLDTAEKPFTITYRLSKPF